ncbi:MAG: arginyltransferase [Gammaproteobacteria bacterium]|nr:arginyltransferase [Gammaproteobacteria bacterium]
MKKQSDNFNPLNSLRFFVTTAHNCGYFDDRQAVTLVLDPDTNMRPDIYSNLSKVGFRRSGGHIYRPHCGTCHACTPIRVPANQFVRNRGQQRIWNKNKDIEVKARTAEYDIDHYRLYRKYVQHRHTGGGMDEDNPDAYKQFISNDWSATCLYEFWRENQLLAVAVTDILDDGLSAVYTFFDPSLPKLGLGNYAILWQIEEVQRLKLDYLYLGYWIADSPKMSYKSNYKPYEFFNGQDWQIYE